MWVGLDLEGLFQRRNYVRGVVLVVGLFLQIYPHIWALATLN